MPASLFTSLPSDKILYGLGGVAVALIAWLIGQRIVRSFLRLRLERIERIDHFDAVRTASPYRDSLSRAREFARNNVRSRYTVISRMFGGTLLLGTIFVAAFPFLEEVPKALVSFLVGVALAVVGVASRPFVENLISGIVISFSNQLRIGDTVTLDGDFYGTVEDINLTHTVIKLWDWKRYIVPNARMLQKEFLNYSHRDKNLWASISFSVSYDVPLSVVERIAREAAESSEYYQPHEAPAFWVRELNEESCVCWLAGWAASPEDAWYLRTEMRRGVAEGFRSEGIRTHLKFHAFPSGGPTGA